MITIDTRITNDKIATEFLAEFEPFILDRIVDGKIEVSAACLKCGGSGYGTWRQDGGVCYKCMGANTKGAVMRFPVKAYAQRAKRQIRAAEKAKQARIQKQENMLEGQRDWCERNGFGRITFDERDELRRQEQDTKAATSQHLGQPKDKITVDVTITAIIGFDGYYGRTYLHKFEDSAGNVLIWKTNDILSSPDDCFAEGDNLTITGTVKEHNNYEGCNQTVLVRVKTKTSKSVYLPA